MPEPDDIVLRVLKTIQQDLSELKREVVEFRATTDSRFDKMGEDFAAMRSLMTFHMGVTMKHQYQLEHIDAEIKALKSGACSP